jgi:hypothetical protein
MRGRRWPPFSSPGAFEPAGALMVGIRESSPEGDGTRYSAGARRWTGQAAS